MADFNIKKGLNLNLAGAPTNEIVDLPTPKSVVLYPSEFSRPLLPPDDDAVKEYGLKPRLQVSEGSVVKRGSVLYFDKSYPDWQFRSPVSGTVSSIVLGERRSLQEIHIELSGDASDVERKFGYEEIRVSSREDLLRSIAGTGALGLIQERPFSRPARMDSTPKSIFVNGMSNAPFRPDINVVVQGSEGAFQAGLNALSRLTDGDVHLCLDGDSGYEQAVAHARNVLIHRFTGPHPSGNTSTHIHHLDPIHPGDTVWAINAVDVITLGESLLKGAMPAQRIVMLAGSGVKPQHRKYYRVHLGQSIQEAFGDFFEDDVRIISGDVFGGKTICPDSSVSYYTRGIIAIPDDKKRHFLGWLDPGVNRFSTYRAFVSKWINPGGNTDEGWKLGTSRNGSLRAMVMTGIYDKYVPLDILVDYITRACKAHDTDEAIEHGILGTDPEDFALCSMVCPSKTDFGAVIKRGLEEIEMEGL